ncbi:hypothetical protein FNV62_43565 [Streptomyces sp. RLB3-17]|uniref:hypothetical protein n=1 Tax=Streptomyces sp. RLB3-17 TaxID=2594455 RepID=UPI001161F05E|nr:hypothetical protein [Streptomyces sp. RLB3-17]QDO44054.1 hypothetical protein FNV62_43565 [Streptomyces sp. RLB3-17]
MDEIDIALSRQLDRPGELSPLLTLGEARAARYALHLFGQGDGPGSQAARDLEVRLDVLSTEVGDRFHGGVILNE